MKFKRGLKWAGFLLLAIGAFIIIIQPASTTGAVIDLSTSASRIWFFIGLGMVIGGIFLVVSAPSHLEKITQFVSTPKHQIDKKERYFYERVLDLSKDSNDAWISQWEMDNLKQEFEKAGFDIRGPERELGGYLQGPNIRHLKLEGYNQNARYTSKHLFITQDPADERLKEHKSYKPNHTR